MITIVRKYEAESAHRLTRGVPKGHKCLRPHGHRYVITVAVCGEPDADGILIEYGPLDSLVRVAWNLIDHNDLNTLPDRDGRPESLSVADNPTVERLAIWFALSVKSHIESARKDVRTRLRWIEIEEDSRSAVRWEPDAPRQTP